MKKKLITVCVALLILALLSACNSQESSSKKEMSGYLVVIDLQNDITKNYKEIIGTTNQAIDWAVANNIDVVYIQHNNLSAGTRTFKPDTRGAELVPELKIVSDHIFTKKP